MEKDITRRDFIKTAVGAGATLALTSTTSSQLFAQSKVPETPKTISMIKLPYAENALEPSISARTVALHYHNHHQDYLDRLKGYIGAHPEYQGQALEELILKNREGIMLDETIFDIAVLLYNHNWYWPSLAPQGGGAPKGKIAVAVLASYGSYDAFRKAFIDEAMKIGVGWVWLVQDGNTVKAYRSDYHDTPLVKGYVPLLAVDVWEHAYYLDYQNERKKYVEAVLDRLLNWEFAEKNLTGKK
jgi:superoxide dismutase, Fe-Mn family